MGDFFEKVFKNFVFKDELLYFFIGYYTIYKLKSENDFKDSSGKSFVYEGIDLCVDKVVENSNVITERYLL